MNTVLETIPAELVKRHRVIGLRWEDKTLIVGIDEKSEHSQLAEAKSALSTIVGTKFRLEKLPTQIIEEVIDFNFGGNSSIAETKTPNKIFKSGGEGPVSELINNVLERAVKLRSSDIHIEPTDSDLVIRVRVDGKLEEIERLPSQNAGSFVSRLKVMSKLDIVEKRRPQDGQFSVSLPSGNIDVRLATVATLHGEKVVLRLLDTSRQTGGLSQLGMSDENLEKFSRLIHSQNGMVITAGPTGSGKTTTLHSAIKELNTPTRNVSTLEDPVEYVVSGVNHIAVNDSIGTGFAVQLRAILRQDPDIVMVGETRDSETARIGVQAALSGRLVLTSLHATDVIGAIYRLIQMDIEPYLVAASLKGVISQRLVRRVCSYCAEDTQLTSEEKLIVRNLRTTPGKMHFRKGLGCTVCRGTGFRDRVGVYQILEISDEMRELISTRPMPSKVYELAREEGLRSLSEEAIDLAIAGETTLGEVIEVVGLET
jgi:type IV pilus assembly protein PilB